MTSYFWFQLALVLLSVAFGYLWGRPSRRAPAPHPVDVPDYPELLSPWELAQMEAARVEAEREAAVPDHERIYLPAPRTQHEKEVRDAAAREFAPREMAVIDDAPKTPKPRKPRKTPAKKAAACPPSPSQAESKRAAKEGKARMTKGGRGMGIVP